MQRHLNSASQNKKRESFLIFSLVILWIMISLWLAPIYEASLTKWPRESPEEAAVQCQYGPIYTTREYYQFPFNSVLDYVCCESKYDSLYEKTMTQELTIIKRDVICEYGLKVSYKIDFIFDSDGQEKVKEIIQALQERFPTNKSITYWHYPTYERLRRENYLIDQPLFKDTIVTLLITVFSFVITGTLLLFCAFPLQQCVIMKKREYVEDSYAI